MAEEEGPTGGSEPEDPCRLCYGEEAGFSLLVPSLTTFRSWVCKWMAVEVNAENGLSHKICFSCMKKVQDWITFNASVRRVQKVHFVAAEGGSVANTSQDTSSDQLGGEIKNDNCVTSSKTEPARNSDNSLTSDTSLNTSTESAQSADVSEVVISSDTCSSPKPDKSVDKSLISETSESTVSHVSEPTISAKTQHSEQSGAKTTSVKHTDNSGTSKDTAESTEKSSSVETTVNLRKCCVKLTSLKEINTEKILKDDSVTLEKTPEKKRKYNIDDEDDESTTEAEPSSTEKTDDKPNKRPTLSLTARRRALKTQPPPPSSPVLDSGVTTRRRSITESDACATKYELRGSTLNNRFKRRSKNSPSKESSSSKTLRSTFRSLCGSKRKTYSDCFESDSSSNTSEDSDFEPEEDKKKSRTYKSGRDSPMSEVDLEVSSDDSSEQPVTLKKKKRYNVESPSPELPEMSPEIKDNNPSSPVVLAEEVTKSNTPVLLDKAELCIFNEPESMEDTQEEFIEYEKITLLEESEVVDDSYSISSQPEFIDINSQTVISSIKDSIVESVKIPREIATKIPCVTNLASTVPSDHIQSTKSVPVKQTGIQTTKSVPMKQTHIQSAPPRSTSVPVKQTEIQSLPPRSTSVPVKQTEIQTAPVRSTSVPMKQTTIQSAPPVLEKQTTIQSAPPVPEKQTTIQSTPPVPEKQTTIQSAPSVPVKQPEIQSVPPVPTSVSVKQTEIQTTKSVPMKQTTIQSAPPRSTSVPVKQTTIQSTPPRSISVPVKQTTIQSAPSHSISVPVKQTEIQSTPSVPVKQTPIQSTPPVPVKQTEVQSTPPVPVKQTEVQSVPPPSTPVVRPAPRLTVNLSKLMPSTKETGTEKEQEAENESIRASIAAQLGRLPTPPMERNVSAVSETCVMANEPLLNQAMLLESVPISSGNQSISNFRLQTSSVSQQQTINNISQPFAVPLNLENQSLVTTNIQNPNPVITQNLILQPTSRPSGNKNIVILRPNQTVIRSQTVLRPSNTSPIMIQQPISINQSVVSTSSPTVSPVNTQQTGVPPTRYVVLKPANPPVQQLQNVPPHVVSSPRVINPTIPTQSLPHRNIPQLPAYPNPVIPSNANKELTKEQLDYNLAIQIKNCPEFHSLAREHQQKVDAVIAKHQLQELQYNAKLQQQSQQQFRQETSQPTAVRQVARQTYFVNTQQTSNPSPPQATTPSEMIHHHPQPTVVGTQPLQTSQNQQTSSNTLNQLTTQVAAAASRTNVLRPAILRPASTSKERVPEVIDLDADDLQVTRGPLSTSQQPPSKPTGPTGSAAAVDVHTLPPEALARLGLTLEASNPVATPTTSAAQQKQLGHRSADHEDEVDVVTVDEIATPVALIANNSAFRTPTIVNFVPNRSSTKTTTNVKIPSKVLVAKISNPTSNHSSNNYQNNTLIPTTVDSVMTQKNSYDKNANNNQNSVEFPPINIDDCLIPESVDNHFNVPQHQQPVVDNSPVDVCQPIPVVDLECCEPSLSTETNKSEQLSLNKKSMLKPRIDIPKEAETPRDCSYGSLGIVSLPLDLPTTINRESDSDVSCSDDEEFYYGVGLKVNPNDEKHSRKSLKESFDNLQKLLPKVANNPNASKINILKEAKEICEKLKTAEMGLNNLKNIMLRKEKQLNKQKLKLGQALVVMATRRQERERAEEGEMEEG